MGLPYEHGLHSTLLAMRLAGRLGVDTDTAFQTYYYGCLLFYVGCTVDAEMSAELFDDGVLLRHFNPVMFGTPAQTVAGIVRALADSGGSRPVRAMRAATLLPKAVRGHQRHVAALCEVAQMLSARLGLPSTVRDLSPTSPTVGTARGRPPAAVVRPFPCRCASSMWPGMRPCSACWVAGCTPLVSSGSVRAVRSILRSPP